MFTKKLNTLIIIASQLLNFAIIMFFAVLFAKLVWWLINPTMSDVYVERMSATQFDKSAKYIVNRYPLGVIATAKAVESASPAIIDQIKLTGVYHSNDKDSMALIEVSGKTLVFKIGSLIMNSATVKAIGSDQVTVSEDGREAVVKISNGSGTPGVVEASNPQPSNYANQVAPTASQNQPSGEGSAANDFRERRRKMIEEFAQQRGNFSNTPNTGNNNQAGNDANNNNTGNNNANSSNSNNLNSGNNTNYNR